MLFIWGNISTGGGCRYKCIYINILHTKKYLLPFTREVVILKEIMSEIVMNKRERGNELL